MDMDKPWTKSISELLSSLSVDLETGLSAEQVGTNREKYGPNRTRKTEQRSLWTILLDQFKSLIVILLLAAAVVAFLAGEQLEAGAILAVILINSLIGFFVEVKAVRSMESLRQLGEVKTVVRRAGEVKELPAEELVVGDVVLVEAGDVISADLRLLEANNLQADESVLTGESVPAAKSEGQLVEETPLAERENMLFKGTAVTRGSGEAVVVATGEATELGQISSLVDEAEEEVTPLEERLEQLGQKLIWLTLMVAVLVTISGVLVGKELVLMVETGIALAVAAIPEGLPIVATIALARGMLRMARRNALIRRLSAVETLGSTGIICTDKTGTLTENRLTVTRLVLPGEAVEVTGEGLQTEGEFLVSNQSIDPAENEPLREMLETGMFCNNAALSESEEAVGEPLEVALLVAGRKSGMKRETLLEAAPEVEEFAFDSDRKMMATLHEQDETYRLAVKGAPESVLDCCEYQRTGDNEREKLDLSRADKWLERSRKLAEQGLRVLALATRETNSEIDEPYEELVFQGLVGFLDPPRKEMRSVLDRCQSAGLRTIMVTGDHPVTARRIGEEVGLVEEQAAPVDEGKVLKAPAELSDREKRDLTRVDIFARVSPAQKLNLIDLHQGNGSIVAMTGDGVNDAPALKKADIGIAMGQRGTQVAQDAADMVLTDDAFSSIVTAIEQGRTIFNNIRSFVLYLLSCNISEILAVGLASMANFPLPILPLQILFLNLVTDVFPALALGMGESEEEIMQKPPRDPESPIIGRDHWMSIGGYGLIITATVLGALGLALAAGYPARLADGTAGPAITISFYTLALAQLWHVFNMRNFDSPVFRNNVVTNPYVWGALVLCVGLLALVAFVPPLPQVLSITRPDLNGWLLIGGMSLVPLVVGQLLKLLPVNLLPVGD